MPVDFRLSLIATAVVLSGVTANAAPARAVCGGTASSYAAALCFYHQGDLAEAYAAFTTIVEADEPRPETLKSRYFLARTLMKQRRWDEASAELIKIYSISAAFYEEWSCDFLLGEARRALGLD